MTAEENRGVRGRVGGGKSAERPQGRAPSPLALSSRKMAAAPSWERWSGAGVGMASGRAGRSSPGPPSSRWSGGLATIGWCTSRGPAGLCADLRVGTGPGGRGLRVPGAGACAPGGGRGRGLPSLFLLGVRVAR